MSGKKKQINPIIGIRIKQSREKLSIEQQELAKRMELTKSAMSKVESGAVDVNSSSLEKYSKILGVSVNYLLGITDDPSPHIIAASTITTDNEPIIIHSEAPDKLQQKKNSLARRIFESNYTEEQIDKIEKMIDLLI